MLLDFPLPLLLIGLKTLIDAYLHEKSQQEGSLKRLRDRAEGRGNDGPAGGAL